MSDERKPPPIARELGQREFLVYGRRRHADNTITSAPRTYFSISMALLLISNRKRMGTTADAERTLSRSATFYFWPCRALQDAAAIVLSASRHGSKKSADIFIYYIDDISYASRIGA